MYHLKNFVLLKKKGKMNSSYHLAGAHDWALQMSLAEIHAPVFAAFTVVPRLVSVRIGVCCE
jgi:hypothetical protein